MSWTKSNKKSRKVESAPAKVSGKKKNDLSCSHLSEVRSREGPRMFSHIENLIQRPHAAECLGCGHAPPTLYACIACSQVVCKLHARVHAAGAGHSIAIDLGRLELYCCSCEDQVYDEEFDAAVLLGGVDPRRLRGLRGLSSSRPPPRVEYRPWDPDPAERTLILEHSSPAPWGLRGLNNLGNTCFMNSVLQALLHTPPLRNYFLSDNHNRYVCRKHNNLHFCLPCELDALFSLAFSANRTPFTPANFLYSWWQHASNLASYEQQDAHEFFISILDGIHEKLQINQGKPQSQVSSDCCIAHKVFSGILRSDVMCTACGFTSTTYDPCLDISLDLEPNKGASTKTSKKSKQNSGNINLSQNSKMATLMGCLDRFTRPERLGSDQKFFCQQCQVRQESLKQMSIRKLPMVSCFHIKRFEHSSFRKMTRKVDSYLQFPFSLDLAPYLSSSILKSRFGNRMFYFDGGEPDASNEFSSEFELFAVITHKGKLDAGHYVTYLRLSNQWYKCDDSWITQVSDNVVRASQGYMMFYVQKMLYYKARESSGGS